MDSTPSRHSGNVLAAVGIPEPDIEHAKADLVARIHLVLERRRISPDEAAALLNVTTSELPVLLQGRLATSSLDQLLRMLTWLGDDIEITIRPRLSRTNRGIVRVLQAASVERPDRFEPTRHPAGNRPAAGLASDNSPFGDALTDNAPKTETQRDERQLLNKWHLEKLTSLDITTIYRKMKAGSFPQPVRVGRRRVAWRTSDIIKWQHGLEVGTESAAWMRTSQKAKKRPGGRQRG
jgi:prophage regulatory protein